MRRSLQSLLFPFLLLLFVACHSHADDSPGDARTDLIDALKELEHNMTTRDSAQLGRMFRFPIPDSVMHLYLDDSVYNKWNWTHRYMPREAFDSLFPKIMSDWDIDLFKDFCRHIDFDKLSIHNSLKRQVSEPTDYCASEFEIKVEGDSIIELYYGTVVNPEYVRAENDLETHTPNDCKHAVYWTLAWNGKRLRVLHQKIVD